MFLIISKMSIQLHVDSTFRDRYKYPNSCDFVIDPLSYTSQNVNTYINPLAINFPNIHSGPDLTRCIILGSPISVIIGWPGVAFSTIPSDDNFFADCTFMWRQAANTYYFTKVSYSDLDSPIAGQSTLLLYPPLPGIPLANDRFNIYYNTPYTMGSLQAGSTTSNLVLSAAPYFVDPATDNINDMWLMITDTENNPPISILGQCYKITAYDSITRIATVTPSLPVAPAAGIAYEVYKVYKEGVGTMWYSNGIKDRCIAQCRNVTLTGLTLPNFPLSNRSGGKIDRYPYLIVTIRNEGISATSSSTIATNNDEEHESTFIVPINITLSNQRYFTITVNLKKKMLLDFNRPIRVSIKSPEGEVIKFAADNPWVSTLVPWFSSHTPANLVLGVDAVRYPGYTPETPPPIVPGSAQISIFLMVDI